MSDTAGYSGYMFCIYVNDLKTKHTIPIFDVNLRNDNEVREAFVTKLPANPPIIHSLKKQPVLDLLNGELAKMTKSVCSTSLAST